MSELTIVGTIAAIMPTQQVSEKFSKREFVVETLDEYPQVIKFELTQQRVDHIDSYTEGEQIKVHFNVKGRKWHNAKKNEDVYFVTLQAWRLEREGASQDVPPMEEQPAFNPNDDDLPF